MSFACVCHATVGGSQVQGDAAREQLSYVGTCKRLSTLHFNKTLLQVVLQDAGEIVGDSDEDMHIVRLLRRNLRGLRPPPPFAVQYWRGRMRASIH